LIDESFGNEKLLWTLDLLNEAANLRKSGYVDITLLDELEEKINIA